LYTLWLGDLVRATQEKIDLPGSNMSPNWSPDGRFFIFTSMRKGHFDLWQYRMDEGRAVELIGDPYDQNAVAVSNDGKIMLLEDTDAAGAVRMAYAPIDAPQKRTIIDGLPPGDEVRFSPDDRWIAASIPVGGRIQIVVRPFPGPGPSVTISPRGGSGPVWPRTGSSIFYRRDDEIVAVRYSIANGRFTVDGEEVRARVAQSFSLTGVAPDGRFLIAAQLPDQSRHVRVVLKWFSELPK
jgi:hypothetical protein